LCLGEIIREGDEVDGEGSECLKTVRCSIWRQLEVVGHNHCPQVCEGMLLRKGIGLFLMAIEKLNYDQLVEQMSLELLSTGRFYDLLCTSFSLTL
jgi:hypothetical protein